MRKSFRPKITLFHCMNAFKKEASIRKDDNADIQIISMACSSMVKDVFLLRAFEAGADAVAVLVCPEGQCRYVEGNIRAKKRIKWVKNLLDDIGLDGRRLSIFNISAEDEKSAGRILDTILSDLDDLGPNPAA